MEISKKINATTLVISLLISLLLLIVSVIYYNNAYNPKYSFKERLTNLNDANSNEYKMDKYEDFCKLHDGKSNELEGACNKLTEDNCNKVSCCVYANGNKCVAGSQNGATYKTDANNETINVDYYYYKNKCFGNCEGKQ